MNGEVIGLAAVHVGQDGLAEGRWLFRRCAEVCSCVNAYADRLAAISACLAGRR